MVRAVILENYTIADLTNEGNGQTHIHAYTETEVKQSYYTNLNMFSISGFFPAAGALNSLGFSAFQISKDNKKQAL